MKILAMYLPQFHRVKENDEWWGDGFTEWTTVKQAKPLYEGHVQPIFPNNNYYYNLLDKKTMQWQADLMKKYGIDGMCMYHYWFKDGKQILEKPADNLLKWKDIDMPFCLCWANETWARSWSGLQGINVWADICEPNRNIGKKILLEQKYGNEKQWKEHFQYLLPFFLDKRYIKIDEKPVFIFYQANLIPCLENMIDEWDFLAKNAGLKGVYVIANNCRQSSKDNIDMELLHEPSNTIRTIGVDFLKNEVYNENYILDYDLVWNNILENKRCKKGVIQGGFVKYDDTPRRGKKGLVVEGATPKKFEKFFAELLAKNKVCQNEIVFLNAWNEWGEGMFLEPDVEYKDEYLMAVLNAKKNYKQYIPKYKESCIEKTKNKQISIRDERMQHYCDILDRWLCLAEQNISLEVYLYNLGYKSIALYGYGILGKHFEKSIIGSLLELKYIVDKNKDIIDTNIETYYPDDKLPKVDAIIVSPTFSFGKIYCLLKEKGMTNILSLEHIINECIN